MKPHPETFYLNYIQKIRLKHNSSRVFKFLFLLTKLIPSFIITHDWNILHTKGISKYLFELSFGPLIHRINSVTLLIVLLIMFFLLSVIPCIILIIYYHRFKKYDFFLFNKRPTFKICVALIYFIPFLMSQYIFSICVEIFFLRDHDSNFNKTYLIILGILSSLLIVIIIALSVFLSIIFIGPFYTTGKVLVSNIGTIETKWIFFAVCQGISQLEYHIDFDMMTYIKSAVRGIYALYYIYFLINVNRYLRCKNEIINVILGMGFVSSIGEFAAMYSFNKDLVLLSSNIIFIVLKLVLEIFITLIMITAINVIEHNTSNLIFNREIDSKRYLSNKKYLYPMFSKFILYYSDLGYSQNNLHHVIDLLNNFQRFLITHKESCNIKRECFCLTHRPETIKSIFEEFIHANETKPKKMKFSFKEFCPALFDYVEFFLLSEFSKSHTSQNGDLILVLILFFMNMDKNYNQSYYYLDKFLYTTMYKNSFVMKIQVELIKKKMKHQTKNECLHDEGNGLSKIRFKNMIYFIEIQKEIQIAFDLYYDFLIKTSLNDLAKNSSFEKTIKTISQKLQICKKIISYYIDNYRKQTVEKSYNFQLCSKLSLYYKYFYGSIPSKIKMSIEPLTNYLNLSKYNTADNIIMVTFSNIRGIQMNLKYMSDSLIVDLGYHSHLEAKLDYLSDILFNQYASVYETYIITEILKGNNKIEIPYILFTDKNHYLKVYSFDSIVIVTDKVLYLLAKLKPVSKENACYVILNNMGNIIGINEEFTKVFYLNMSLINKLQVVLFNDLLGINFEEQNINKVLSIKTTTFYENINMLNANMMLENNQEVYATIYQSAREAIGKIKRNIKGNLVKELEIHLIPFSLTKDTKNNLFFIAYFTIKGRSSIHLLLEILSETKEPKQKIAFQSSKAIPKISTIESVYKASGDKKLKNILKLSKNKIDLIEKINLISEFGFTLLHFIYGKSLRLLNQIANLYKSCHSYTEENVEASFEKNIKLSKQITKRKIHFHMYLFIIVFLIFLFFIVFILLFKDHLYEKCKLIIDTQLYLILAKKIFNSITSSVTGMIIQKNKLQGEYIDNNFLYNYDTYRTGLIGRIEDYLDNFKRFRERFYSNKFQSLSNLDLLSNFLIKDRTFITMGNDYNKATEEKSLFEIFNYLHIRLNKLVSGMLNPLSFNKTNDNYEVENITRIDSDINVEELVEIEADTVAVFMIENALTTINYPLIEMIDYFEELVNKNLDSANELLLILNLINAAMILILLFYQGVVYYNMANELFIKWFLNVCYLKYFSLILIQKTKMIRNVIDIGTIDKITTLGQSKIKIENSRDESELLKSLIQNIDEDCNFHIIPFHPIMEASSTVIDNFGRALLHPGQFDSSPLKPAQIKRQLTQLQEENKTKKLSIIKKSSINGKKKSITYINNNTSSMSTINNITGDSLIAKKGKLNEINPIASKDKKIVPEIDNTGRIFLLIFSIIIVGCSCVLNYIFIHQEFNLLWKYSRYKTITLLRSNYFQEILLVYHIILLKNNNLYYEYQSHGYLNHSIECSYLNQFTVHDTFNETVSRFKLLDSLFEVIVNDPSSNAFQKNLINYERMIRTDNACDYTSSFLAENQDELEIQLFVNLQSMTPDELSQRCKEVGRGFNSKGIREAFSSLVNHVVDSHKDFIAKGDKRDEAYIHDIINDSAMQTYQIEANKMLELIYFDYQIALAMDYKDKKKSKDYINSVFFICIIILLVILGSIYLAKFTNYFLKLDSSIERVKLLVFHTIFY